MSTFLYRLGQRCARHPWRVFGAWLMIAAIVLGVNNQLGGTAKDNFTVPGVEAQEAGDILSEDFPEFSGVSGQMVFHVDQGHITDPANAAAIDAALDDLSQSIDVTKVSDPFDPRGPTISADGCVTATLRALTSQRRSAVCAGVSPGRTDSSAPGAIVVKGIPSRSRSARR